MVRRNLGFGGSRLPFRYLFTFSGPEEGDTGVGSGCRVPPPAGFGLVPTQTDPVRRTGYPKGGRVPIGKRMGQGLYDPGEVGVDVGLTRLRGSGRRRSDQEGPILVRRYNLPPGRGEGGQ